MARVRMMAGNWKMHKLNGELPSFFEQFTKEVGIDQDESLTEKVDILFAMPYTLLAQAARQVEPRGIRIAAQNIHWEESGAYTGEVSLAMIKEVGVTATLVGHSERRQYFGETDATVAKKTQAALAAGVMPVVCVGETLAERESGRTVEVVTRQVLAALSPVEEPLDLVLAYEPVWAIGTGRSATAAQAQEVHQLIRQLVRERYDLHTASTMRVLYGGSANPATIHELLAQPDIDGALVGGASLKPADFAKMVRVALAK